MMSKTDPEIRSGLPVDVSQSDDDARVSGYAAVFGERTSIADVFDEIIEPGAFKDAIGRDDVVFLINHTGLPMARTRSGTLKLKEDDKGLFMETSLNSSDPDVLSIIPKMERGDLDKMSFAFRAEVEEWDDTQDPPLRTIKKAKLYDVSIVTNPQYQGTDIGLRALNVHRENSKRTNYEAAKRRVSQKIDLDIRERVGR